MTQVQPSLGKTTGQQGRVGKLFSFFHSAQVIIQNSLVTRRGIACYAHSWIVNFQGHNALSSLPSQPPTFSIFSHTYKQHHHTFPARTLSFTTLPSPYHFPPPPNTPPKVFESAHRCTFGALGFLNHHLPARNHHHPARNHHLSARNQPNENMSNGNNRTTVVEDLGEHERALFAKIREQLAGIKAHRTTSHGRVLKPQLDALQRLAEDRLADLEDWTEPEQGDDRNIAIFAATKQFATDMLEIVGRMRASYNTNSGRLPVGLIRELEDLVEARAQAELQE
ncbi:hypothetical protein QBC39DRAFT_118263 [Podospora conica]|nr:hypothetical protein QBC39DRAFT_118263 [Schizothecium conicum]